jgi:asparagine synthase (glutamine-hydrolysing)
MCGIAGIAGSRDPSVAAQRVQAMMATLARRGPDGAGLEIWQGAVLGHRRLAIFDLSDAGRQPMLSPSRDVGVVFNGAIYNFRDLRGQLEQAGCAFKSQTDTEVLVHGYREWGLDALVNKLRGMFAFSLWDARQQKLFLVRDRLGVKPLAYALDHGTIGFASTVSALSAGGFGAELDAQALIEFLEFGYVTEQRAIYREVLKVPPASVVEWNNGEVRTRQYWSPPTALEAKGPSFNEAVEESQRLLLGAVERRLQADVPVGALLSGGIDSSLICWAISKLGGNVKAYTIGTPGDEWDETADATATATRLGIEHEVIQLRAEDLADVDELSESYAEPFACASALGMLRVSRGISTSGVKVVLTGDGGDDAFLGYPEHRHLYLAEKLARYLPASAAPVWWQVQKRLPDSGPLRRGRSFLNYATGGLGAVTNAHDGWPLYQSSGMLGERIAEEMVDQRRLDWSAKSARNVLGEFLIYDRLGRFVSEYLTKVDGATMRYSLEARSPFLDQELWEFAASLPYALRLRGNSLKAVLREIAARNVGVDVARGKKRGFGVPVQRWMAGLWYERVHDTFKSSLLAREGWIESKPTLALLERTAATGQVPNQLWYIFVLEAWLRRHRQQETPESPPQLETVEQLAPIA